MTEKSTAELNFIQQLTVDASQAVMRGLNPNVPGHLMQDFRLARGWLELRIGFEAYANQIAALTGIFKKEGVGNHLQKGVALFRVLAPGLLELALLGGVVREFQDAVRFSAGLLVC